jgi:hypothetical protein
LDIISSCPDSLNWIKTFLGAEDFLNGSKRYCLWLKGVPPQDINKSKKVLDRINLVAESRLKSPTPSVKIFAKFPTIFTQDRQPSTNYLALPEVSSENKYYIPIAFLTPDIVCSNKLQIIPNATIFMFGILTSIMHVTWTKHVSGRLESRISYSPSVYNNFSFPEKPF